MKGIEDKERLIISSRCHSSGSLIQIAPCTKGKAVTMKKVLPMLGFNIMHGGINSGLLAPGPARLHHTGLMASPFDLTALLSGLRHCCVR